MLTAIINRANSMFNAFGKSQTYGSALEAYIVSNNPQDICDIDRLSRQFDQRQSTRASLGWVL